MTENNRTMEDDLTAIDISEVIRMSDGMNKADATRVLSIIADFISKKIVMICDKISDDSNSRKLMEERIELINEMRWSSRPEDSCNTLSLTPEYKIAEYRDYFSKDDNDYYEVLNKAAFDRDLVPLFVFAVWSKSSSKPAEKANTEVKMIISEFRLLRNARNIVSHGDPTDTQTVLFTTAAMCIIDAFSENDPRDELEEILEDLLKRRRHSVGCRYANIGYIPPRMLRDVSTDNLRDLVSENPVREARFELASRLVAAGGADKDEGVRTFKKLASEGYIPAIAEYHALKIFDEGSSDHTIATGIDELEKISDESQAAKYHLARAMWKFDSRFFDEGHKPAGKLFEEASDFGPLEDAGDRRAVERRLEFCGPEEGFAGCEDRDLEWIEAARRNGYAAASFGLALREFLYNVKDGKLIFKTGTFEDDTPYYAVSSYGGNIFNTLDDGPVPAEVSKKMMSIDHPLARYWVVRHMLSGDIEATDGQIIERLESLSGEGDARSMLILAWIYLGTNYSRNVVADREVRVIDGGNPAKGYEYALRSAEMGNMSAFEDVAYTCLNCEDYGLELNRDLGLALACEIAGLNLASYGVSVDLNEDERKLCETCRASCREYEYDVRVALNYIMIAPSFELIEPALHYMAYGKHSNRAEIEYLKGRFLGRYYNLEMAVRCEDPRFLRRYAESGRTAEKVNDTEEYGYITPEFLFDDTTAATPDLEYMKMLGDAIRNKVGDSKASDAMGIAIGYGKERNERLEIGWGVVAALLGCGCGRLPLYTYLYDNGNEEYANLWIKSFDDLIDGDKEN